MPWFITGVETGSRVLKMPVGVALTCVRVGPGWKARDLGMLMRGSGNVWSLLVETVSCSGDNLVGAAIPEVKYNRTHFE